MYVYIYIGTYLSSEGSEDPSEINFGPILGEKNWAKKIAIKISLGPSVHGFSSRQAAYSKY